jgi:hypothetical protein
MNRAQHARRHKQPRYVPAAPQRGTGLDQARAEHTHPSWCNCRNCTPRVPADGPRGVIGCFALIGALAVLLCALGAAFVGSAIADLFQTPSGRALLGIVTGAAAIAAIGGAPLIFRSF